MAQQATAAMEQMEAAVAPAGGSANAGAPESERRLAWEALRERDLEEKMGQGAAHDETVDLAKNVMKALRDERGQKAYVGADVFIEWDPSDPRARVSPDGFILEGQDPSIEPSIWQTWEEGCDPPRFALEVVSPKLRAKDYDTSPHRYSMLGVEELLIFDAGPLGKDSFALQLYQRTRRGQFLRVYAGAGPVESRVLGAFWVVTDGGKRVRLARDAEGKDLVPSDKERAEAERARADAAEARVRELEALLKGR
ncbi:MAG: Uma2 family endonuclease [Byssovorax sp.]